MNCYIHIKIIQNIFRKDLLISYLHGAETGI